MSKEIDRGDGQRIAHPLPQHLCDALAIRVDTLPRQLVFRMKPFALYSEGRLSYESVRRVCAKWRNEPALGLTEGYFPPHCSSLADFQHQYAPEQAFVNPAA